MTPSLEMLVPKTPLPALQLPHIPVPEMLVPRTPSLRLLLPQTPPEESELPRTATLLVVLNDVVELAQSRPRRTPLGPPRRTLQWPPERRGHGGRRLPRARHQAGHDGCAGTRYRSPWHSPSSPGRLGAPDDSGADIVRPPVNALPMTRDLTRQPRSTLGSMLEPKAERHLRRIPVNRQRPQTPRLPAGRPTQGRDRVSVRCRVETCHRPQVT